MDSLTNYAIASPEAVADRLFGTMVDAMDVVAIAIGDRLGYYRALDAEPLTPAELATQTGHSLRYTREWLEQQAMSGHVVPYGDAFALAPGVAETLARPGTSLWLAPMMRQFAAAAAQWSRVADAAAAGKGLAWQEFGPDMFESQSDVNAAMVLECLVDEWLPGALPGVHARLEAGEPVRVADIGCGGGWAGIALARRYPAVRVDGYDVDPPTVELARGNVRAEGLDDQVRILALDVGVMPPDPSYDLVMAFECIHDMPHPVEVLTGIHRMLAPGGRVLVADMAGAERFDPDGDLVQRCLYGYSVLLCLPDAMTGNPEGATGTVMRPSTMDAYARAAGFTAAVPLRVEHELWRFYELTR
jgi:SAM-dependent methyltransferase